MEGGKSRRRRGGRLAGQARRANKSKKTEKAKKRSPWLAMDLVFRTPPTAQIAWALLDDEHRLVLDLCQGIAQDKTLAWLEDSVAAICWGSGGKHRAPVADGLIVAVFRQYESTASRPLLRDHVVESIRDRLPDAKGTWREPFRGADAGEHRRGWHSLLLSWKRSPPGSDGPWEPREVTPGKRQPRRSQASTSG